MKRCEKCLRVLTPESTSKDPDLCKPCYRLMHQFDDLRSGIPNDREHWA